MTTERQHAETIEYAVACDLPDGTRTLYAESRHGFDTRRYFVDMPLACAHVNGTHSLVARSVGPWSVVEDGASE